MKMIFRNQLLLNLHTKVVMYEKRDFSFKCLSFYEMYQNVSTGGCTSTFKEFSFGIISTYT